MAALLVAAVAERVQLVRAEQHPEGFGGAVRDVSVLDDHDDLARGVARIRGGSTARHRPRRPARRHGRLRKEGGVRRRDQALRERRRVAVGDGGVIVLAGRLEDRAGEVAQRRAQSRRGAPAVRLEPLEQRAQTPRLDGRAADIAGAQASERTEVGDEQPLRARRLVRQDQIVGEERQRGARHAFRDALLR